MQIADGGGGYGGTDWAAKDVVAMWQALENQDTTPHWQMVSGWRKSYELTLQHMSQVRNYRENLAAAWPPEKSPAAAAYLARLDQLIASLQATYDAAVVNYGAFSGATSALATSRHELKKIYDTYVANQAKLADFRVKASRPTSGKALPPPAKPPVTDAQMEQLNNRARAIMYGLSSEIIQARATLTKPKVYDPINTIDGGGSDDGRGTFVAPPIPPIVPLYPDAASVSAVQHAPTSHAAQSTMQPSTNTPHIGNHPGSHPGLVLGGVSTGSVITPPTNTGIIGAVPTGNGPIPSGTINPTPVLPSPSVGPFPAVATPSSTSGATRATTTPPGAGMRSGTAAGGGGLRAIAPGGVIGGIPSVGVGQPGVTARTTQRINPIGGLINPGGSGTPVGPTGPGPGKPARASVSVGPGIVGGRNSEHRVGDGSSHWDPDNPWETAEGVPPVVVPSLQQRVDPGPAIGLS
ncbi:MAG TPA: hypothetical protein VF657_23555 [Actinoplanes sp.]